MAWTELTRTQYERGGGRYASDLTDAEWALIAPFLPGPKHVGRPRTTKLRSYCVRVSSVQAIVASVQCCNQTESQTVEFTQLVSDQALRSSLTSIAIGST